MNVEIGYHFYDQILPAYVAYKKAIDDAESGGLRIMGPARLLCEYLFHLRERIEPTLPPKTFTRKAVTLLYADYGLMADIANALKHNSIDHNPNKLIQDASSIKEVLVQVVFSKPQVIYSYLQPRILVELLTGEKRDLLEIATGLINFWAEYLFKNNFISSRNYLVYHGDDVLTQVQVASIKQVNVHVEVPYDVYIQMADRQYNLISGKWRPYSYGNKGGLSMVK